MRIITLPLARVKTSPAKLKPSDPKTNTLLIYYHFDLISPRGGPEDLSWHKRALKSVTDKTADLWTSLGKAQKGSWKLWMYELGERVADQIGFEELALRNIDPSLGPTVPGSNTERVDGSCKIPLIYPPSLYPVGLDNTLDSPLAHLRALVVNRGPRHRRGFYLWMLIAPFAVPITLIPLIPNLPLFFCVWRSWSHYRAYRSSQYLSALLDRGLIEPKPNFELDRLYTSFILSSRTPQSFSPLAMTPGFSEKTSARGDVAADGKSEAMSGTGPSPRSECMLLSRGAMPQVLGMFCLSESMAVDMCRAMNQAHARVGKSS